MAAGKTTVAREVARLLDYPVLDLDDLIIQRQRRSIRSTIEQLGESRFRSIETGMLRKVFIDNSEAVIALGGGAWTLRRNRDLVAKNGGVSVWIDAPFDLCWARIQEAKGTRPLAPDRDTALRLFRKRRPIYAETSIRLQVVGSETVTALAQMVVDGIGELNPAIG